AGACGGEVAEGNGAGGGLGGGPGRDGDDPAGPAQRVNGLLHLRADVAAVSDPDHLARDLPERPLAQVVADIREVIEPPVAPREARSLNVVFAVDQRKKRRGPRRQRSSDCVFIGGGERRFSARDRRAGAVHILISDPETINSGFTILTAI